MMADLHVGDAVRFSVACRQATITYTDGEPVTTLALADPATVSLTLTSPAGVATVYTYPADLSKASTGLYYLELTLDEPGEWRAEWVTTGDVEQAEAVAVIVNERWAA